MALRAMILFLSLAGCRGASDDYDDFLKRRSYSDAGIQQVVQSSLQDLSGMWLIHALLAGGLDLGLRAEITMNLTAQPITLHARIWLATSDITVDPVLTETDTTVAADGTFDIHLEPLLLKKGSTPGLNTDVSANAILHASTQSATAWCGTATGTVTEPLSLDLEGSTFAARPDMRSLDISQVPQSCFPRSDNGGGPVMMIPKPAAPDLSSVSSMVADLSGDWIISANLAGSVPLNLWAHMVFTPGTPDGGTTAGSLDGALRRATDSPGSIALTTFSTLISSDGRFEIWLPELIVGQVQASVLLVGATRSMDVFCGAGAGQVQKPFDLDLMGTTFAAARWVPGTPVPDAPVNHCE